MKWALTPGDLCRGNIHIVDRQGRVWHTVPVPHTGPGTTHKVTDEAPDMHAMVHAMTFVDSKIRSPKWAAELLVLDARGGITAYLIEYARPLQLPPLIHMCHQQPFALRSDPSKGAYVLAHRRTLEHHYRYVTTMVYDAPRGALVIGGYGVRKGMSARLA